MYSLDFEYAGKRLSDFGCVVGYIDSSAGMLTIDIGCDITFNTIKNNHSSIHSVTSSIYENVYTTTFEIVKGYCGDPNDYYFTAYEARNIVKWLNRREYHKFKPFFEDDNISDISYYGSFNVEEYIYGGKIVGFSLEFTANSPYAFEEPVSLELTISGSGGEVSIFGNSDEYGLIYPKFEVTCLSSGDLIITNETTGTYASVANCISNELITLDGEHKIITTDSDVHDETLANDFNYEFVDLIIEDTDDNTENIYSSTLPCNLTITYLPVRKVGVI